eukprot:CAMPEP_0176148614 /NCGR_PEP_ID=MMETSP0120_2-20121206/75789_1 /TAXON_ID=160619 /ORGANISM="Kryptoperidinium foliaceum, Strain CCMP 1326" /LENGTH=313 /DNA_ID=CAMNT_0017485311 /DNA_START=79 /DNA_END=1018 /DNA_ORIENTATION=-
MKILFKTLYPFQGDPAAQFAAGEMLVVENPAKANINGWALGKRMLKGHSERQYHRNHGWFPLTYVTQIPDEPSFSFPSSGDFFVNQGDEEESGFGGDPMGGSWTNLKTLSREGNEFKSPHLSNSRSGQTMAKTTAISRISKATSNARLTASSTASKAVAATKSCFDEVGHRLNDMRGQHNAILDQQRPSQSSCRSMDQQGPIQRVHQKDYSVVSGNGFLPGRATSSNTIVEKAGGVTRTTATTTEKASGGFMPWIPGQKTTYHTTTTDAFGNQTIYTEEKRGGGFYVIPLGPVGLAACGAMAAKNAYDAHQAK